MRGRERDGERERDAVIEEMRQNRVDKQRSEQQIEELEASSCSVSQHSSSMPELSINK